MIFLTVSILVFAATVALILALQLRKKERAGKLLRERVGVARGEEWAPLQIERDERLSAFPLLDRVLRALSIARRLELLLYQAGIGYAARPRADRIPPALALGGPTSSFSRPLHGCCSIARLDCCTGNYVCSRRSQPGGHLHRSVHCSRSRNTGAI